MNVADHSKSLWLALCLSAALFLSRAEASSLGTPEGSRAGRLAMGMELYAVKHDGKTATTWKQLAEEVDLTQLNSSWRRVGKPTVEERYQFVDERAELMEEGNLVVMIRTIPIETRIRRILGFSKTQYRYMVVKTGNGKFYVSSESEKRVAAMLQRAGVKIEPPPGSPNADVEYRWDEGYWEGVVGMALFAVAMFGLLWFCSRRSLRDVRADEPQPEDFLH
jgi:hypothetical protein